MCVTREGGREIEKKAQTRDRRRRDDVGRSSVRVILRCARFQGRRIEEEEDIDGSVHFMCSRDEALVAAYYEEERQRLGRRCW